MSKHTNKKNRDLKKFICGSLSLIFILLAVLLFCPLTVYHTVDSPNLTGLDSKLDLLMNNRQYVKAIKTVDSIIENKQAQLPRFEYFDRFLPEDKRIEAKIARSAIYELQWKRISILQAGFSKVEPYTVYYGASNNKSMPAYNRETLKKALEEYSSVPGYNQEAAKAMLNTIRKD